MVLKINKSIYFFPIKEIWFSEYPYDVDDCSSVTFYSVRNKTDLKGFHRSNAPTVTIDLTENLDKIWKDMSTDSTKRLIKQAIKNNVKIKINEDFDKYFNLLLNFRKNKGLIGGYFDLDIFKKHGLLFTAELDGELLAGNLFFKDEKYIYAYSGGSKRFEVDNEKVKIIGQASKLIHWEAIKYAKEKGITTYDLGGFWPGLNLDKEQEGINYFKLSLGGIPTTTYIYWKDYSFTFKIMRKMYSLFYSARVRKLWLILMPFKRKSIL
jgi:lipid II:glycine glycyltransferase (peptidoglycan interpeptide bridge formation enzyme)